VARTARRDRQGSAIRRFRLDGHRKDNRGSPRWLVPGEASLDSLETRSAEMTTDMLLRRAELTSPFYP